MQTSNMRRRPWPVLATPSRRQRFLAALALGLAAGAVVAAANPPELAAEQLAIDSTSNTAVGDAINQEFAQVFELHDTGHVSHVMLPLNCLSSPMPVLRVTIQSVKNGMPGGRVLASQDVPGYVLDTFPSASGELGMRMVQFERPALLKPGTYAFTISGLGGLCQIWYGRPGDSYPGGEAFLSTMPSQQPGVPRAWNFPLGRDLTFQVFQQPK